MASRTLGLLAPRTVHPPDHPTGYARYLERIINNESFFRTALRTNGPEKLFAILTSALNFPPPTEALRFQVAERLKSILAECPHFLFSHGYPCMDHGGAELNYGDTSILHRTEVLPCHEITTHHSWTSRFDDELHIQIARQNMVTLLFVVNHPSILTASRIIQTSSDYGWTLTAIAPEPCKPAHKTFKELKPYERPLAWAAVACSIASAVDYFHRSIQIPHGSIGPDNIRFSSNGVAKLFDIGVARTQADLAALRQGSSSEQDVAPQDILKVTSSRTRDRFIQDQRDFGVTMLRLLDPDEQREPAELLKPQLDALPANSPSFSDAIFRLKQLVVLLRLHSLMRTTSSVSIFAEHLLPISFLLTNSTVNEITIYRDLNHDSD
ncbi:hypothetical protein DL93DRAFT_1185657 [Clavulina sp. PMI_390]|nr:hypothetical protein DL93DRAFT_1185657 [Clavulina sp. PMI_390]